ncbi:MAG TPA: alcohol dehydrogenase catalytic domain-containing protein, partial [Pirellulaceae bacterium]|nr:alcohol dehydrogenase catalytic domain-containing protein [Pirellulaceae bacterium]
MANETFRSWVARRSSEGEIAGRVEFIPATELAPGEVLIDVEWSSLNYKDALAATGQASVVKQYPHVPGIDAAGVVRESNSTLYQPGDAVLVTGY